MLTGFFLTIGGGLLIISDLIQPQDLWFKGLTLFSTGVTLMMIVMVASTIGKVVMLFDEILNQTTNLYETMLRQERGRKQINPFSGMFNSITIKNKETGEESTTPLNPDNISESLDEINKVIIDSLMKGPQDVDSLTKDNPSKRRGRKKNLENMNLGELEIELAKAIKEDDYEKASKISTLIQNINNPIPPEEKKED